MNGGAPTNRERWRRIEKIYHNALELEPGPRAALLDDVCAGDPALRQEVEALLACESKAGTFIETPALDVAVRMLAADGTADLIGRRVGSFVVTGWLGSGGMGDVYRARDSRLGRDVALKVLPPDVVHDAVRVARFTREAQVLASLNHPNVAAIYGVEDTGDLQALVLELVEGPTLADCILRGPMPIDEALPVARQIAEALEAAHEQGIVHRDLKPANIKLRLDATVKVLDFGIAKALDSASSGDETASTTPTRPANTQIGMILGTAPYMSPEQARGRLTDKRSDIWSFGVVLFEMLSGRRVFAGDEVSDTVAAVLRQEVDWAALPASTPMTVRRLLRRCIERDVRQRLRDIGEARVVLADPDAGQSAEGRTASTPVVARFAFTLGEGQQFNNPGRLVAIAPDGTGIIYSANQRLYLRLLSDLEARPIAGTEVAQGFVAEPVFSPDGRSVTFVSFSERTLSLKRIAVTGGAAMTLCPIGVPFGISWGADGIVFGQGAKGIMRVSSGGKPDLLVGVEPGELAHDPQMLPDGQNVLFTLAADAPVVLWDDARIVTQHLRTRARKILIEGGSDARYLPTGHIVYAVGGVLCAVPFDSRRLEVTGGPIPVVEGIRRERATGGATAQFSCSESGSLVYVPGPISATRTDNDLALIDRHGVVEPLNLGPGAYEFPRISPDGTRIVFGTVEGREAIIWIAELVGGKAVRRLTFSGRNRFPIWSADGRRVAFQSDREGDLSIFCQSADGLGTAERLTRADVGSTHVPEAWSPTDDALLFGVSRDSHVSLWALSLRDGTAAPFGGVRSSSPLASAFSPDGRWIAYGSTESGGREIYVQAFPGPDVRYQVSRNGTSIHPLWSRDGTELFFHPAPRQFCAISVTSRPNFTFGNAVAIPLPSTGLGPASAREYDVTPDGTRFVGVVPAGQAKHAPAAPEVRVILNWFDEVKARMREVDRSR
jgi:serine/threonine-protein kinase